MTTVTGRVFKLTSMPLSFTIDDGDADILCLIPDTPEWVETARSIFGKVVVVTGTATLPDVLHAERVEVQGKLFEERTP